VRDLPPVCPSYAPNPKLALGTGVNTVSFSPRRACPLAGPVLPSPQAFQRVVDRIGEKVEAMDDDSDDVPLSAIMQETLKELTWVRVHAD
jgi:hypothetical protein